jgi:adenylate cyclase
MRHRLAYLAITLLILVAGVLVRLIDPAPIARLRNQIFDTYQQIRPRAYDPMLPVRIVDIDDASLTKVGQWPWPRSVTAELVDRIAALGATVIALDIIFPEPDRLSATALVKLLPRDEGLKDLEARLAALPTNDQMLARALAAAPSVLGFIALSQGGAARLAKRARIEIEGPDPLPFLPEFKGIAASLEELQAGAAGTGALNWLPEHDQIVRRIPLIVRVGKEIYPSLAAEALRLPQPGAGFRVASAQTGQGATLGIASVSIGGLRVPTDQHGQMWLAYTPHDARRFIPAHAVLEGKLAPDALAGKVVLIGTSAAGLFDSRATPIDGAVPGVEIHAQAIEQILLNAFLVRPDYATGLELAFLALAGAITSLLIFKFGAVLGALAGAASLATVGGLSWLAYVRHGLLLDPVYPALLLTGLFIANTTHRYRVTERERNRVRNAFSHYMSPAQVERLAADPSKLSLGGENREITLLFSDVRGFTARSEGLDAQALTRFINQLFTPLSNTILEQKGTIDKFMGDAVMAFWNAPLDDPEHALNACRAALQMLRDLEVLNRGWEAEARAQGRSVMPVAIGIGLNTGTCCVGNFGSEQRFDYSVIGDDVNLASRLEGLTKLYGVPIVVGERTAAAAAGLALIELDLISVKGKELPARVFGLLGDERVRSEAGFAELSAGQSRLIALYRTRRFAEAQVCLAELRRRFPGKLADVWGLYQQRIQHWQQTPPPPDWDGRAIADSK